MTDDETGRIGEEIARMEPEPLLPVEKKLIVGSLVAGALLLLVLLWAGTALFPGL
jgi:hypothetical protein